MRNTTSFVVIVRYAPDNKANAVWRSSDLIDHARDLGALSWRAVKALTPEGHWFVLSQWRERMSAKAYLEVLQQRDPQLVANSDRTELRSHDPQLFHALVTVER